MGGAGGRALLAAALALASGAPEARGDESRLGGLIRWYLNEPSPRRREDFLEAIEKLAGGDARVVAEAIRKGEHFRHHPTPSLRSGGKPPVFDGDRAFEYDRVRAALEESAGDFAELALPEGYDPARPWPLVLDLKDPRHPLRLPVPPGAIHVRINVQAHAQARRYAWAAEALVMGLLAHLPDVVRVDPDRVVLRADGAFSTLVWYVALHNPDRFAAVLGTRTSWDEGADLAPNGRTFRALGLRAAGNDARLAALMDALRVHNPLHRCLEGPSGDPAHFRPALEEWWDAAVRPETPVRLDLVAERGTALRCHWVRVVPHAPSRRKDKVGRHWEHRVTARPARLEAQLVLNDAEPNLVTVKTERVAAFDLLVDPEIFDLRFPLRVRVNDAPAPVARVIYPEIVDVLEDYRDRRDTRLLPLARLTFPVR